MIIIDKQAILTFGTGDINVVSGYSTTGDKVAIVGFKNQEQRDIGSVGDIPCIEVDMDIFDVVMKFDKKESIDVVIRALQQAKENLERRDNIDKRKSN